MGIRGKLARKALKLEIIASLACARVLIVILPFRYLQPLLGPMFHEAGDGKTPELSPRQLMRAINTGRLIERIAVHLPFRADCVPQAMTGRWMLGRWGIPTKIKLGARRGSETGRLEFHAWLSVAETVIIGGEEIDSFRQFDRKAG